MSELVTKSAAPVAVDNTLATLTDGVNIEQLTGLTAIVCNLGGGSGNEIHVVVTEYSDDGVTYSPGNLLGSNIASGASGEFDFSTTSPYVRIQAACDTGEDTTAIAWLYADSAVGRICTLSDVKDRLGIESTDNDHDATLNRILTGIEAIFNGYTGRSLIVNAADVTEYYTGLSNYLQLARYPIVSVTSIKESYDYDFDSATALTANTDYRQVKGGKNGVLYRTFTSWLTLEDGIEIVYRGGYCAAGLTPGTGEVAMPADLREAAIQQSSLIFKRKDDIGLSGAGFKGESFNKFTAMTLLPMVKDTLDRYRRPRA